MRNIPTHNRLRRMLGVAALGLGAAVMTGCHGPSKAGLEARKELREKHAANVAALAYQQAEQNFGVGNLEQALAEIETAIAYQPQRCDLHVFRARVLIEQNRLLEAHGALKTALELAPADAGANYYTGLLFQRWSNDEEAVQFYAAAFEAAPDHAGYLLAYVETLVALKRLDEAQAQLDAAGALVEHHSTLRRIEGHIALLQDRPNDAADHFRAASLLRPDDDSIVEDLILALARANRYADAEFYLTRLLAKPGNQQRQDLLHFKAQCLAASDRLAEAGALYVELTRLDPTNQTLWYEYGTVAYRLDDQRRLATAVERLLRLWPDSYEGYLLRGLLHQRSGDAEAARRDFQRAAGLAQGTDVAPMIHALANAEASGLAAASGASLND